MDIREMKVDDWEKVARIYQKGIDTSLATFERQCPSYEVFDNSHLKKFRYVILEKDRIVGWCAVSGVSNRKVYKGVVEVSIYIDLDYTAKGIGTKLLSHVVKETEDKGYWTVQAGIMENNIASICLHEKCGFRKIGYREKIGKDIYGIWRNVILMERRSDKID